MSLQTLSLLNYAISGRVLWHAHYLNPDFKTMIHGHSVNIL